MCKWWPSNCIATFQTSFLLYGLAVHPFIRIGPIKLNWLIYYRVKLIANQQFVDWLLDQHTLIDQSIGNFLNLLSFTNGVPSCVPASIKFNSIVIRSAVMPHLRGSIDQLVNCFVANVIGKYFFFCFLKQVVN